MQDGFFKASFWRQEGGSAAVDALSAEEWNYIRGLFLADGCSMSHVRRREDGRQELVYVVHFDLNGEREQEIIRRLAWSLREVGLNPHILKRGGSNAVRVLVWSKPLFEFLPSKKLLMEDLRKRERFFEENKLYVVEYGVPFLAGLLDGDGYCRLTALGAFSRRLKSEWTFTQSKLPFLVDYIKRFVESLTLKKGVNVWGRGRRGESKVRISKYGVDALLSAGIARYSLRVVSWLKRVDEARRERAEYCGVVEVARMLGVCRETVRYWVKTGELRCEQVGHRCYISIGEVEKLREELLRKRKRIERVENEEVRLADAAGMLRVSRRTLYYWFRRGKLHAALVDGGRGFGHRFLVVSKDEVESLKSRMQVSQREES